VGLREYPQVYERQRQGAGEASGLDLDFFSQLASRSGCAFTYEIESQPRVWSRISAGTLDLTSWVVPTEERLKSVVLIPILTVRPLAYTWRSAATTSCEAFLAQPALRAVAVKGASYGAGYDACLDRLTPQRMSFVADVDIAARVFAAHRVDLIVTYPWVMARHLPTLAGQVEIADWEPSGRSVTSALALSRQTVSAEAQARLLDAVRAMAADGSIRRLVDIHLPGGGVTQVDPIKPLTGRP